MVLLQVRQQRRVVKPVCIAFQMLNKDFQEFRIACEGFISGKVFAWFTIVRGNVWNTNASAWLVLHLLTIVSMMREYKFAGSILHIDRYGFDRLTDC